MSHTPDQLEKFGWHEEIQREFTTIADAARFAAQKGELLLGRVTSHHGRLLKIQTSRGEKQAILAGTIREGEPQDDLPVVGDWVAASDVAGSHLVRIETIVARRTKLSRRTFEGADQILAANIDNLVIMHPVSVSYNAVQIHRLIATAHEGGIIPLICITKTDLNPEAAATLTEELKGRFENCAVVALSSREGSGIELLLAQFCQGSTVALIGPSGAGKSTLVNRLVGDERMKTADVGSRGLGRHTTTHRQLIPTQCGIVLIDTPGIRGIDSSEEIAVGISASFDAVQNFAQECRFRDCRHEGEPGCRVREAVKTGELQKQQYLDWHDLQRQADALAATRTVASRLKIKQKAKNHAKRERAMRQR